MVARHVVIVRYIVIQSMQVILRVGYITLCTVVLYIQYTAIYSRTLVMIDSSHQRYTGLHVAVAG